MGRDFTIFRSMGSRPSVRTEQHDSRWLNGQCWGVSAPGRSPWVPTGSECATHPLPEPKFVDVFWVPESENPDDDKIYFFFREMAVERQQGLGKASISRIGQICRVGAGSRSGAVGPWCHPPAATPRPTERRGWAAQPGEQVDDVPEGAPGVRRARHRRRRHALR